MEFSSFHSNDNISYLEEKIFKDSLRKKKLFNKFIDLHLTEKKNLLKQKIRIELYQHMMKI